MQIVTASILHGLYRIHQTTSRETVYTSVDGMVAATVAVDQSSIERKDNYMVACVIAIGSLFNFVPILKIV